MRVFGVGLGGRPAGWASWLALALAPLVLRAELSVVETNLVLRQVDYEPAIEIDASGYPRLDLAKVSLSPPRVVERSRRAVILENRHVRVTVLPEMGRVYSFVNRFTGNENLWTNAVAKPITGQQNDTGWWLVLGGVEYTLPRGEHGTTWALPWRYELERRSPVRTTVRMTVREPVTGLEETLRLTLDRDAAWYETDILIRNPGATAVRFAHWINPMWAPGGRGELTPNTELIVPCEVMVVTDRDFNRWMLGERRQRYATNPLRFVRNWRSLGDLLCDRLTGGFYSAFSHEANEGIVRVFDPQITPGMNIWTWGYPPSTNHQNQYSLTPNLGYVEMWGGTARDFSDEALGTLGGGRSLRWREWMYPYSGIGGLTGATRDLAINFIVRPAANKLVLGLVAARRIEKATVTISLAGRPFQRVQRRLAPDLPFYQEWDLPKESHSIPVLTVRQGNRMLYSASAN